MQIGCLLLLNHFWGGIFKWVDQVELTEVSKRNKVTFHFGTSLMKFWHCGLIKDLPTAEERMEPGIPYKPRSEGRFFASLNRVIDFSSGIQEWLSSWERTHSDLGSRLELESGRWLSKKLWKEKRSRTGGYHCRVFLSHLRDHIRACCSWFLSWRLPGSCVPHCISLDHPG